MSLPPPSAAPKEEAYTTDSTIQHHPPVASKITTNMGPPATPFTPRPVDPSHLQPSLQ